MITSSPSPATEYVEWEGDSGAAADRNNPLWYFGVPIQRIVGFKIISVTIPVSYYVINHTNNTFVFNDPSNTNTTITIPPGNYNASTICSTLQSLLHAEANPSYTYPTTHSATTGKLTIEGHSPWSLTFPTTNNLHSILGFSTGTISDGGSDFITAPIVMQITGPTYLILHSSELGILNTMSFRRNAESSGSAICQIPINANPDGTIYYTDPEPTHLFECQGESLSKIDFYMTLGNNTYSSSDSIIDLNGLTFSVKIGFVTEAPTSSVSYQGNSFKTISSGPTR